MLRETKPGLYQSELMNSHTSVIHGFSTRSLGDMRDVSTRHQLKALLGVSTYRLVGAQQIHKNKICVVGPSDYGKTVAGVDGLVFRQKDNKTHVALSVVTGDCVSLLFEDQEAGVIGAAHAGWKGTRDHIGEHMVRSMVSLGARADNIHVAFGPYIGPCCYNVSRQRAAAFGRRFRNKEVVISRDDKLYLDLGLANIETLTEEGIRPEHIDHTLLCTSDHVDIFYSHRKDTKVTYGEQMAMIALAQ